MSNYITTDGHRIEVGTEFFYISGTDARPKIVRVVYSEGMTMHGHAFFSTRERAVSARIQKLQAEVVAKQKAVFALVQKLDGYVKHPTWFARKTESRTKKV